MDAVVFDMDGTLVDSAGGIAAGADAMLDALGRERLDLATYRSFIGEGAGIFVRRCLKATGGGGDAEAAERIFVEAYMRNPLAATATLPGAAEALAALRARGLAIGLCTNTFEARARAICDGLGLAMDVIVGADTLGVRKPDPAPLLHALERLGAKPGRSVYVGDSGIDAQTAAAARVPYVYVAGGYDHGGGEDGARWRLASLAELAPAVERAG